MHINCSLTVFFEVSFWVGVYERSSNDGYEVCKIIFGSEPKDYDVYDFMLKNYHRLKFSPSLETAITTQKRINPKRMQRSISKQLDNAGVCTKAQLALKVLHSQNKLERKILLREKKEAEKQRQFLLHQEKRKEKHRGH